MSKKSEARLERERAHALTHWVEILDALFCEGCGLQGEAVAVLEALQWTVADFLAEVVYLEFGRG